MLGFGHGQVDVVGRRTNVNYILNNTPINFTRSGTDNEEDPQPADSITKKSECRKSGRNIIINSPQQPRMNEWPLHYLILCSLDIEMPST